MKSTDYNVLKFDAAKNKLVNITLGYGFENFDDAKAYADEEFAKTGLSTAVRADYYDIPDETGFPVMEGQEIVYTKCAEGVNESVFAITADGISADIPGDPVEADDTDQDIDYIDMVEALEENEDQVECKVCFGLFPKVDCKKLDVGYICPVCGQELASHQGTNLDLVDADPTDLQYDDPRITKFELAEPEIVEVTDGTDMRAHEAGIKPIAEEDQEQLEEHVNEELTEVTNDPDYYKNVNIKFDEKKKEITIEAEKRDTELVRGLRGGVFNSKTVYFAGTRTSDTTFEFNGWINEKQAILLKMIKLISEYHSWESKEFKYDSDVTDEDNITKANSIVLRIRVPIIAEGSLEEHVNEEHPPVESDQELKGIDNAVVDCQGPNKVVTHAEDEKPLDCLMKKEPLEKPLTEEYFKEAIEKEVDLDKKLKLYNDYIAFLNNKKAELEKSLLKADNELIANDIKKDLAETEATLDKDLPEAIKDVATEEPEAKEEEPKEEKNETAEVSELPELPEEPKEDTKESLNNSEALKDAEENSDLATENKSENLTLNEDANIDPFNAF